jgi:hypothetical protein
LFFPFNPQNLKSANDIKKLNKKEPFFNSVKTLLLKYDVAFVNEKKRVSGQFDNRQKRKSSTSGQKFSALTPFRQLCAAKRRTPDDARRIRAFFAGKFRRFNLQSFAVIKFTP